MRGHYLPSKNKLLKGWYFKMTKKKCTGNCGDGCSCTATNVNNLKADLKANFNEKELLNYGFYSKVLQKPFDSLNELKAAEEAYLAEQKAKADKAAQKKAEAQKVEQAFKALNAARKAYKEDLTQLTKEYSEELENLKKAYDLGKKDIHNALAAAEEAYAAALNEFVKAHPEGYHLTLKDGDFETTLSSKTTTAETHKDPVDFSKLFELWFGLNRI
jgi:hypothetical protein